MRAIDVMTANVITVHPSTSVQAVAKLLSEQAISGVPVVDAAGRLVGIVSEGDLLHRVETGTERRPGPLSRRRRSSWWLDTIGSPQELARKLPEVAWPHGGRRHDARSHFRHRDHRTRRYRNAARDQKD